MLRTNEESHIRPQPNKRARRELEIPMASIREKLEAMRPGNTRGTTSREEETHSLVGRDVTNMLLLELLQKQNNQIQDQREQLLRMIEASEKAPLEDNPFMFKKLTNLNPATYDGAQTLGHLRIRFWAWKSYLIHYNAPRSGG